MGALLELLEVELTLPALGGALVSATSGVVRDLAAVLVETDTDAERRLEMSRTAGMCLWLDHIVYIDRM